LKISLPLTCNIIGVQGTVNLFHLIVIIVGSWEGWSALGSIQKVVAVVEAISKTKLYMTDKDRQKVLRKCRDTPHIKEHHEDPAKKN